MADQGHELTEDRLADLEKRLREEYTQAAEETQKSLDEYLRKFKIKDATWKKAVDAGLKTKEEYDKWRVQAIAGGDRWEKMKERIVSDQLNVNKIARQIIDKEMPTIFELNANYALYQVEHDANIDTSLTLYNREAVDRIYRDNPEMLLPPGRKVSQEIADGKATRWERQKVQSVMTQGLLQGDSIPKLAKRLATSVADSDFKAAVRNARTMATNAQNGGRYDAYDRLENNGVELTLEWAATLDNRTRHEHRMMHGQRRKVGEPFEVDNIKIMYPAQTGEFRGISDIPQQMLWNCRCTILAYVKGFEHDTIKKSDKMGKMSFEDWLKAKPKPQNILHQYERGKEIEQSYIKRYKALSKQADEILAARKPTVAEGTDISATWQRRADRFDFEIDDVINAQGFDGKPRVVSQEEFDTAVKAANGGKGFIAQRAYTAPDAESLKLYHDELLNGKWYVDCSKGGASYGQGMYGSADFSGNLTDQIKATMDIYKYADVQQPGFMDWQNHSESADWQKIFSGTGATKSDIKKYIDGGEISGELRSKLDAKYEKYQSEWIASETEKRREGAISRVETFTLDPSAKIVSYEEIVKEKGGDKHDIGVYAAMKGYDAIRVENSDSPAPEVVILNRTKVIFLKED